MRRAAKIDAFHTDVRDLFRAHGCHWRNTPLGDGFPDALACFGDRLLLLEIKSGAKAKTGKAVAARQRAFAADFPVCRVTTRAEAEAAIAWLKARL